jgi:hypothetical protein
VTLDEILSPEQQKNFVKKEIFTFSSTYFENTSGKFSARPLNAESQFSPVYGICITDVNDDGNSDILMAGNLDAVQPDLGRFDAGYGVVLAGDGRGGFMCIPPSLSGFKVTGQVRAIRELSTKSGRRSYVVARNDDSVLIFNASGTKGQVVTSK